MLGYLRDAGYSTWSADDAAREVYERPEIQTALGILVEGEPTREALREALNRDASVRKKLNKIMHAPIIEVLKRSAAQFVEIPLLIETCIQGEFPCIWVVTCGEEEQMKRLQQRYPGENLDRIRATQLPTRAKTAFADVIIRTNDAEENVKRYVLETAKKQLAEPQI